jgi:acetoin utilization deacetylase AcuC-like enzyme
LLYNFRDDDYIYIYDQIIGPVIQKFKPEFVLISNGLDALDQDPLGKFKLSCNAFGYILHCILVYL